MSPTESVPASSQQLTAPQEMTSASGPNAQYPVSSTPVEMSALSSRPVATPGAPLLSSMQGSSTLTPSSNLSQQRSRPEPPIPSQTATTNRTSSNFEPHSIKTTRSCSTAIGPSSDQPIPVAKDDSTGPTLVITLLLTTGARHPFKIDPKYLLKRNVDVQGNDPFNLSVYKLKELILREWRDEWEPKPSSPSSIRLISFGKLLDDKAPLKDSKFNHDTPNVVHMTIKPQDFVDEEDTKGGKDRLGSGSEAHERSPGCRCVVM